MGMGEMRIHSSVLTEADLSTATVLAGQTVRLVKLEVHGSRKRERAFEVALSGSGNYGGMYGNLNYPTATWDEWGMVLAEIFRVDPEAIAGPYECGEHFRWATTGRYDGMLPTDQHLRHSWEPLGLSAGGSYFVRECRTCRATLRTLTRGATWAQLQS